MIPRQKAKSSHMIAMLREYDTTRLYEYIAIFFIVSRGHHDRAGSTGVQEMEHCMHIRGVRIETHHDYHDITLLISKGRNLG